jgi:hypothetical protein
MAGTSGGQSRYVILPAMNFAVAMTLPSSEADSTAEVSA